MDPRWDSPEAAGFNGIVAALFGGLHPLWTIPASFLFGGLLVGGNVLQRAVQVPSALIIAINGLVVIFVVAADRYRSLLLAAERREEPPADPDQPGGDGSDRVRRRSRPGAPGHRHVLSGRRLMSELFTTAVLVAVVASAIRLAVPLLLAALGETYGQRSGVLNLGVDGIMLLGAFAGYYAVLKTGNVWYGLAAGAAVGSVLGLASAVIAVTLKAEQGISGIGIFLFGLGMSDLLFQKLVGTPIPINTFPKVDLPVLSDIPDPR